MYPILVDIRQRRVLVVGGGKIATRKVRGLIEAGGKPTVIAPEVTGTLTRYAQEQKITLHIRPFHTGDTQDFQLILICTNQSAVNDQIFAETTIDQLVNDATKKSRSHFFNMAYLKEKEFGIAITSFGNSPEKSKHLKEKIQHFIKENDSLRR